MTAGMISILSSPASGAFATLVLSECRRELHIAERELGAFLKAVENLFGPAVALEAGEIWIKRVEMAYTSPLTGHPNWRGITIMTTSQLAKQFADQRGFGLSEAGNEAT